MLSEQVRLVEANSRTAEEILAELPEWARKIIGAARVRHKRAEGSTYRREDEDALLLSIKNARLEWWRR